MANAIQRELGLKLSRLRDRCRAWCEIGKQAEGKVSLDVGFQIRSAPPFVELVRRIHAGALGEIVAGEAHYYCPAPDERRGCCGDRHPRSARRRALGELGGALDFARPP